MAFMTRDALGYVFFPGATSEGGPLTLILAPGALRASGSPGVALPLTMARLELTPLIWFGRDRAVPQNFTG